MSKTIIRLIRLSATSAALMAFVVVGGSASPTISVLSTEASAANGIRAVDDVCFWEDLDWDEMQPSEQKAWRKLGWTAEMWDSTTSNAYPPSEEKDWNELTDVERRALLDLGYTPEVWEDFDADEC